MRIAIIAPGSRGDIQPYVALGVGLQRAGHTVLVVTNRDFTGLLNAYALPCLPVDISVEEALQEVESRAALEGGSVLTSFAMLADLARRAASLLATRALEAGQGADVVLTGLGGMFMASALAEKLGVPLVQAYNVPITPTAAFPGALFPVPRALQGRVTNRLSHMLTRQALWLTARSAGNAARCQEMGLEPAPILGAFDSGILAQGPLLYGLSPSMFPKPADWDASITVTGFWFLDEPAGWTPSPELTAFLQDGPPPVYIGFGSMAHKDPAATMRIVVEALKQSGQRGLVLSGWGGLREEGRDANLFVAGPTPHAWLFPKMAAVVHHGGAGTTAAGIRAGVPSILVPFHGDQPFWGARVFELGVGPAPISRKALTSERLAGAIRTACGDSTMAARAAALGTAVRAEDGVGNAVAAIGRMALRESGRQGLG